MQLSHELKKDVAVFVDIIVFIWTIFCSVFIDDFWNNFEDPDSLNFELILVCSFTMS